jgi:hypothetical protein
LLVESAAARGKLLFKLAEAAVEFTYVTILGDQQQPRTHLGPIGSGHEHTLARSLLATQPVNALANRWLFVEVGFRHPGRCGDRVEVDPLIRVAYQSREGVIDALSGGSRTLLGTLPEPVSRAMAKSPYGAW